MNEYNGYIKLFRRLLNWKWYNNVPTRTVFIDLLIRASYKDEIVKGVQVKRGQVLTSRKEIATNNSLTEQQTRTALSNLKSTNEITSISTNRYTLITLNNYDKYQGENNQQKNRQNADEQPAEQLKNNQQPNQQAYNIKKNKEKKNKEVNNHPSAVSLTESQRKAMREEATRDEIKENIEYDELIEFTGEEFANLVVDVLTAEAVKENCLWNDYLTAISVEREDVEYVYENGWINSNKKIRSPRAYLKTLLFRARVERDAMDDRDFVKSQGE